MNTIKSEISIDNINISSNLERVECQASNGYGAGVSRTFKLEILRKYTVFSKTCISN